MKAPAKLLLNAPATFAEVEEGKLPEFSMVANTGQPMKVGGFRDKVVIDYKGMSFTSNKLPVVADHDIKASGRIGHTTSVVKTAENTLEVKGVISATGQAAQELQADARNGFPFQASLGADVKKAVFVERGESVVVNGNRVRGPLLVAKETSVYEVTVTALGADPNTSFSISASKGGESIGVFSMSFEKYLEDLELSKDDLSEDQLKVLKASYDREAKILATSNNDDDSDEGDDDKSTKLEAEKEMEASLKAAREARVAEEERMDAISEISASKDFSHIASKERNKLKRQAIKEEWSANRFELELHRQGRPTLDEGAGGPAIHIHAEKTNAEALACAMAMDCANLSAEEVGRTVGSKHREEVMNLASSRDYRGRSLHGLMYETILAAGMYYKPGQVDNGFIRCMKEADRSIRAAGDFSTVSVTGILSNIQNKILLQAFESTDPLMEWIATGSVNDFKTMTGYRMTGMGEFVRVPPGGEIKDMSLAEESYQIKADTYGAKIGLDRTQIINDDLNAFAQVPRAIGRGARMTLNDVCYNALLDNATFFTNARNNYLYDTANLLSIDSLSSAVTQFLRQEDINKKPVDMIPAILLTGTNNMITADNLNVETRIIMETHSSAAAKKIPQRNPHAGKYRPLTSRWLDAGVSSGGNGNDNHWFLLGADPDKAVAEVRFLNGNTTPIIEMQETAPDVLGLLWVGYFDFGVAKKEFRGGVYVNPDDSTGRA